MIFGLFFTREGQESQWASNKTLQGSTGRSNIQRVASCLYIVAVGSNFCFPSQLLPSSSDLILSDPLRQITLLESLINRTILTRSEYNQQPQWSFPSYKTILLSALLRFAALSPIATPLSRILISVCNLTGSMRRMDDSVNIYDVLDETRHNSSGTGVPAKFGCSNMLRERLYEANMLELCCVHLIRQLWMCSVTIVADCRTSDQHQLL